jgi:Surface-adhesin protein E
MRTHCRCSARPARLRGLWLAALAMCATAAVAADWERVGTDGDDNTYALDTSRISRDGNFVGVTVRTEYAKPRKIEGLGQDVFVALDRMVVDCAAGSFAVESRTFVTADGTEVPRGITARADLRFRPAAAGSMSESIVKSACKAAGVVPARD